jgi:hypothetical protein
VPSICKVMPICIFVCVLLKSFLDICDSPLKFSMWHASLPFTGKFSKCFSILLVFSKSHLLKLIILLILNLSLVISCSSPLVYILFSFSILCSIFKSFHFLFNITLFKHDSMFF